MEPILGEVRIFAGNFAPRGWAICDGRLLPIMQNQGLFAILNKTYGGDGTTNFALPDFRGRLPIHPGSTHPLGKRDGTEANVLKISELPPHTHPVTATQVKCLSTKGGSASPSVNYPANSDNDFSYAAANAGAPVYGAAEVIEATTAATGSGVPVNNMMPSLCINYIIAVTGMYPQRG